MYALLLLAAVIRFNLEISFGSNFSKPLLICAFHDKTILRRNRSQSSEKNHLRLGSRPPSILRKKLQLNLLIHSSIPHPTRDLSIRMLHHQNLLLCLDTLAMSSTPATTSKQRSTRKVHDQTPSWASSIESSLSRLNDELDELGLDEKTGSPGSQSEDTSSAPDDAKPRDRGKGKARQPKEPLLHNVLKQNTFSTSDTGTGTSIDIGIPGLSSPLRQDAARILARMNPYLPPNTQPSQWNSVVDLSTTRLATPRRNHSGALAGSH